METTDPCTCTDSMCPRHKGLVRDGKGAWVRPERTYADTSRLPSEVILTWRNGAYYVSEPNFLQEGESVRLQVLKSPHKRKIKATNELKPGDSLTPDGGIWMESIG